jgi:hypothetical protein
MPFTVTIGTTERSIAEGSLSVTSTLGQIGTAEITLPDVDSSIHVEVGQPLTVTEDAQKLFAGTISDFTLARPNNQGFRTLTLSAQDWNALPARYSAGEYEWPKETRLNNIIRDIVSGSPMHDDGIDLTHVAAGGGDLTTDVYNPVYITIADAFNELAATYKKIWRLDYDKVLTFSDWQAGVISATITETSKNVCAGTIKCRSTLEQYANYVIVRYNNFISDFTQSFVGNGTLKDFTVENPIVVVPTVRVNGTIQTMGIAGTDTGKQCYWSQSSKEISFESAPANGATIAVEYRGKVDAIRDAIDAAGVNTMKDVVGGSGVFAKVVNVSTETTGDAAQAIADRLLAKYSHIAYVITFDSFDITAQVGDRISVNLAGVPVGNYVVRSVKTYMQGTKLRRNFEIVTGNILSDGFDAFSQFGGTTVLIGGSVGDSAGSLVPTY